MARRHVSLVVRTETRRRFRAVLDDPKQFLPYAFAALFGSIFVFAVAFGAYLAGEAATTQPFEIVAGAAATVAGFVAGFAAFIVALRVTQSGALSTGSDLLLTAVRHRDVVYSYLVVEALVPAGMLAIPGLLAAVAFGVGSGSPFGVFLFAAAGVGATAVGVSTGFAVGLAIRVLVSRWAILAKFKTPVGILLGLLYFAALTTDAFAGVFERGADVLAASPARWFADLVLLGTVAQAHPARAVGAVALVGVSVATAVAASTRLAGALWYESAVQPESDAQESAMRGVPGLGRPASRIARKTWIRAWRAPIRLIFLAYPLFLFVGPVATVVREGTVPPAAVPSIVVYGAWAAGAALTLNPIGDETPVLPVTLTTAVDGRTFVGATCLAGAAMAVPATLALSLAVGAFAGFSLLDLAVLGTLAALLPALAPGLASGIGAAFPRTTEATVTRGRQAVVPSIPAFAGFSIGLFTLSVPVWLATPGTGRGLVADALGVNSGLLGAVAAVATLGLVGVGAGIGFLFAARQFDEYTVA